MQQLTTAQWRRRREVAGRGHARRPETTGPPVREVRSGATRAVALDRFARTLRFPAHFGATLDALADSLRDAAKIPFTLVWVVDPALPATDADRITEVLGFVEDEVTAARDAAPPSVRSRPAFTVVVVRD
ncbi:barstar family protein [Tersicoccus sp. Bi-70]|uniref:barstar family protein n=1 Tax=Tersicoccus sp. Bi-70 TaxID=1897634 RepID=UPI000975B883|nr:barstar family protein [Tersicoccus sp. Bi-70]OMH37562.1 hypothetical protein BGP79_12100 [Tersicoccus sp. Bi-70]